MDWIGYDHCIRNPGLSTDASRDGLTIVRCGMVEPRGIEPLTFAMPLRRSPS